MKKEKSKPNYTFIGRPKKSGKERIVFSSTIKEGDKKNG